MFFLYPILIFVVAYLAYHWIRATIKHWNMPPTAPLCFPIVGHLPMVIWQMSSPNGLPLGIVWEAKQESVLPIYTAYVPGRAFVMVNDFQLMKEFTSHRGDTFSGRSINHVFDYVGFVSNRRGLVNTNGDVWKQNRRFTLTWLRNFGFGKNLMEQRILNQVDKLIDHLSDEVAAAPTPYGVVDLTIPLKFTVSSIIAGMALGCEYEIGDPYYLKLEHALDTQFSILSKPTFFMFMIAPWMRHVPLFGHCGYDAIIETREVLLDYFRSEIRRIENEFTPGSEPTNVAEAYIAEIAQRRSEDGPTVFNEEQLLGVIDLWAAGMETTANTLKWAFLYMIHHPIVQEKVYMEIMDVCGPERRPNMADAKAMPITVATINEVQRMSSIVPNAVEHMTVEDTTLGGYDIPANTSIMYRPMHLAYNPKIFPNPEQFQPERHLGPEGTVKKVEELIPFGMGKRVRLGVHGPCRTVPHVHRRHPETVKKVEELIPFGMGKRVCLGESMARAELFLIFTAVIQRFRVACVPGEDQPSLAFNMVGTVNTQPYKAALYPRA